jgi:hypothetical protein
MNPFGSFGPGDRKRAMIPAINPMIMIQMMFDMMLSLWLPVTGRLGGGMTGQSPTRTFKRGSAKRCNMRLAQANLGVSPKSFKSIL